MHIYEVIKRPVITEKSQLASETVRQYTFEVDRRANKHQVKEAVEASFPNVTVVKVNMMNVSPRRGRHGRRVIIKDVAWKKAIVTLAAGQSIAYFEGV